eukprot:1612105-Rhodomonas_salina.1
MQAAAFPVQTVRRLRGLAFDFASAGTQMGHLGSQLGHAGPSSLPAAPRPPPLVAAEAARAASHVPRHDWPRFSRKVTDECKTEVPQPPP